jgi:DNA polymerase III subunit delta
VAIYFFWGDDDYALSQAVQKLQTQVLDPAWASFNYDRITPDRAEAIRDALNQAMTPPFGLGQRLVWLVDTPIAQRCSEELLTTLGQTLPLIPDTTVLLLTSSSKPDGRLKSTKLLQKNAEIREFTPIPPWKIELLAQQVKQVAQECDVNLNAAAVDYLVEAVGNNTRQLYSELEKIRLFAGQSDSSQSGSGHAAMPLGVEAIAPLVTASTQSALKLEAAIRQGNTGEALALAADLLRQNEPALRIVATLIGQFRQRLWIKLMLESGERDDRTIAQAADLGNPQRLYFLKKELAPIALPQLQKTLPLLLALEFSLKRQGMEEVAALQTTVIELCQLFKRR